MSVNPPTPTNQIVATAIALPLYAGTFGVSHFGVMQTLSTTLNVVELAFNPATHTIPVDLSLLWTSYR
ncbi:MAG: hypothetical protein F6J94_27730 [Moorea sp. SIO1F2]|uniref:hypothetical protein n=1 Tax=unclassified Moorena TaxID=2683338 RepID=UPI0013BB531E|nr:MULTISPECIES: hypothetical protein [unclassified Moorena]NEO09228.1 hypothetical protein [Moorena sp. SIO3I8]NEO20099.1 hypothetical protein [Moorena sp. SIO4A5]NEP20698.1 hypothetical protein [Moorena sp. SIO3I6]NEQ57218.1 hypothetical protein [Moorena sp. SIO4A1]NET85548.1 hypothetical protein [Moorena sp. SIO1F2]